MTSPPPVPPGEAPGSPADSYELVTREMCSGSDGEADTISVTSTDAPLTDTVSVTSIDAPLTDDISTGDGELNNKAYDGHATQYLEVPPPQSSTTAESVSGSRMSLYTSTADNSMVFSGTETQGSETTFRILDEVQYSDGSVRASGTIRLFESRWAMPTILEDFGCQQLRLTVKMALAKCMLPPRRSFRVVYIGQSEHWMSHEVNSHIGAALNKTSSSSCFNIVQGASGSNARRRRSDSELVVDQCSAPRLITDEAGSPEFVIRLSDGSEMRVNVEGEVESSTAATPDLVIFCHSGEDKLQDTTRFLRLALQRSRFPTLDIAVVRPYTAEESIFKSGNLCLHLEGRNGDECAFETQKILPIDIYAFLSLDPTQLNRHLAYLAAQYHQPSMWDWFFPVKRHGLLSIPAYSKARKSGYCSRSWEIIRVGTVLATFLMLLFYCGPQMPSFQHPTWSSATTPQAPQAPILTPTSTEMFSTSTEAVLSAIITNTSTVRYRPSTVPTPLLQAEKKLSRSQRSYLARMANGAFGGFDVALNHTDVLILQPTDGVREVMSQLQNIVDFTTVVELTANNSTVPYHSFWTADKLFLKIVLLEDLLFTPVVCRVKIMEGGKVLIDQHIEVMLGRRVLSPWVAKKVGRVSRDIRHGLAIAQTNVKGWSVLVRTNITPSVSEIRNRALTAMEQARYWKQDIYGSVQSMAHQLIGTERKALEQAVVTCHAFTEAVSKEVPSIWNRYTSYASTARETVTANVWESTRPWRTSPRLIQARKRAMRMRCKLEKTFTDDAASCRQVKD